MIRLRPLERNDLSQLRDWRNDPEIYSRVREYRYLNMENQKTWFDSLLNDRSKIMFGIWNPKNLIGVCGLTSIDWVGRKAEVSIYIGLKDARKQGLGTECLKLLANYAFNECNLQKLWAEIFENNPISEKLFKKCGYVHAGTLVNHAYKNGDYLNSSFYELLRKGK